MANVYGVVGRRLVSRALAASAGRRTFATAVAEADTAAFAERKPRTLKVADKLVRLTAIDAEGQRHAVVGLQGQTLLRALCNAGLIEHMSHRLEDLSACSAHCEVRISQEWLDRMPPPSSAEQDVLAAHAPSADRHARLGCQVVLQPQLQDMVVAVPEPRPWDTL